MADGIGAGFAPAHAAVFWAVADDRAAGAFDWTGADLPTVGDVRRIVHAMHVVAEVARVSSVGVLHRGAALRHIDCFQYGQHRRAAFAFEPWALLVEPRFALRLILGLQTLGEFDEMFLRVPEVENARRARKEPREHFFQARAAVRQCNLLLDIVPTDVFGLATKLRIVRVQVVKTGQIPHLMRRHTVIVVLALRIIDHADVSHATFRAHAARALLTHARGVETDIAALASLRIALPVPLRRLAELHAPFAQPGDALARCFGRCVRRSIRSSASR